MGKPPIEAYNRFSKRFYELTKQVGKKQYLVPYLMSSHPGSTLSDAVLLAQYLCENNIRPEQVQDFYPTPGTVSTCMFYTGLDPYTLKPVYVARESEERRYSRRFCNITSPKNAARVRKALRLTKREDLLPLLLYGTRGAQGTPNVRAKAAKPAKGKKGRPASKAGEHTALRGMRQKQRLPKCKSRRLQKRRQCMARRKNRTARESAPKALIRAFGLMMLARFAFCSIFQNGRCKPVAAAVFSGRCKRSTGLSRKAIFYRCGAGRRNADLPKRALCAD